METRRGPRALRTRGDRADDSTRRARSSAILLRSMDLGERNGETSLPTFALFQLACTARPVMYKTEELR